MTLAEDAQHEAVEVAGNLIMPLDSDQRDMLDRLTTWAEKSKNKADAKATAILEWLKSYLRSVSNERTRHSCDGTKTRHIRRETHVWLEQILTSHGFGGDRLAIIHGSMDQKEREIVKAAFQANPKISPVRILLATDAASEGIDLQNHCNYLIHVEIPWNPNVMEQRNGRIDRHGQKESEVFHLAPCGKGICQEKRFR